MGQVFCLRFKNKIKLLASKSILAVSQVKASSEKIICGVVKAAPTFSPTAWISEEKSPYTRSKMILVERCETMRETETCCPAARTWMLPNKQTVAGIRFGVGSS